MSESIRFEAPSNIVPGKVAPVKIFVNFDKPTKVRGIHATFYAAEKTTATYMVTTTDSKGNARVEPRTTSEHTEIANESFLLFGEARKGFIARIGDSMATWVGGGSHEVIESGTKEFSVDLNIPSDAPASFKGKKSEVFYKLDVIVDLPIKIDWSKSRHFKVGRQVVSPDSIKPVHVMFPDEPGRSLWDRTFGKNVTLNLALDRNTLLEGETALAMLTVETPEPFKIGDISVNLAGTESVTSNGHNDTQGHVHPLESVESPAIISNDSVFEFEVQIPEICGPFTQSGNNFKIEWWIEVRLKIPWATDPTIRVPIILLPKA